MMKPTMIGMTVIALLLTMFVATVHADERGDLKQRFKERYPTLRQLKDEGKIGETASGFVDVVKVEYAQQKVGDKTIAEFLAAENKDRGRLYELFAADTGTTAKVVAERNALRHFEKAAPTHYLRPSDGKWVQKKDYHP